MSIGSVFHPARKQAGRHAQQDAEAVTGAIRELPDNPALHLPVPAAQVAAARASGPQPAYPRGEHPYPQGPRTSGPQPSFRPRPGTGPQQRMTGPQRQAPAPERPRLHPLPPRTPVLFSRDPQERAREVAAAHEALAAMPYPAPDPRDHTGRAGQYAALMRYLDRVTGTRSPFAYASAWPAPQAPEIPNRGLAITGGNDAA